MDMKVAQTLANLNIYTSVTNTLTGEMNTIYTDVFETLSQDFACVV